MRKVFLSKMGIVQILLNIIIQSVLSSPLLIVLFIYCEKSVFFIITLIYNLFLLLLKSILVLKNNTIYCSNILGGFQRMNINDIHSLKILSEKEYTKLLYGLRASNLLISNVFYLLIPIGKTLFFKNSIGRNVVIGVWSYSQLYQILEHHSIEKAEITCEDYGVKNFTLDISFPYGLKIYFFKWTHTLLVPCIDTVFIYPIFYLFPIKTIIIPIVIFIFLSILYYIPYTRITVNTSERAINIKSFSKERVIIYDSITDVCIMNSYKDTNQDTSEIKAVFNGGKEFVSFNAVYNGKPVRIYISAKDNEKLCELLCKIQKTN